MRTILFWSMRIAAVATALGIAVVGAAALVPKALGYEPVVVINGSMEPKMPLGSIALTKIVPIRDIGVGDIITFTPEGAEIPTTHRVVAAQTRDGKRVFTTKGDANETVDKERVVLDSAEVPRVEQVIPYIGWIIERAKTPVGAALLFLLPIGGLLLDKPRRADKQQDSPPEVHEEPAGAPVSHLSIAVVARAEAAAERVETAAARTDATLARLELWVERVEAAAKRTDNGTKQNRDIRSAPRPVALTSPPPPPSGDGGDVQPSRRMGPPPPPPKRSGAPPPPTLRVVGEG